MAKGIWDKKRQSKAAKKDTLTDAIMYLLEPHDLKGANPYLPQKPRVTFTLEEIRGAIEDHPELASISLRKMNDRLRDALNGDFRICRVGSTRSAMYSYNSIALEEEPGVILNDMLRALIKRDGNAEWKDLQDDLEVGFEIMHLEFNSAVNFLKDNGIVEKQGQRPEINKEAGHGEQRLTVDSRRIVCTPKTWGWDPGELIMPDEHEAKGTDEFAIDLDNKGETGPVRKIRGAGKKTHSITLTDRTSLLLEELQGDLAGLPEDAFGRPAKINRSTIVELALWALWKKNPFLEDEGGPSEMARPDLVAMSDLSRADVEEFVRRMVAIEVKKDG